MNLAFYGKGGIGKSTIASNISAALALSGKRVLHIGCDPKADSTRPLTQKKIPTVLNQLNTLAEDVRREDLVFPGKCGVSCIEAGGPQAGLGCAGMGITAMEETLRRLGILEEEWDTVVYDVLGDVVCGGFSVPMRKGFADRVYVVTSADYMSPLRRKQHSQSHPAVFQGRKLSDGRPDPESLSERNGSGNSPPVCRADRDPGGPVPAPVPGNPGGRLPPTAGGGDLPGL